VTDVPERRLVCPYCGGQITATLEDKGFAYTSYQVCGGYECAECGAEWDTHGGTTGPPLEGYWRSGKPDGAVPPWMAEDQDSTPPPDEPRTPQ
jgi:DNA-directed RNA polymerase subunit RPC12/RpoP